MMRRWALGAVLAIAVLAGAAPARAQYFGQNKVQYHTHKWRMLTSDHFNVYFYAGCDSLAMRVLDLAEKTHVMLSRRMGHSLERRVPIILYASHHDFAQTNITPELIDAGTGGFTEVLRNRVVLPFTGSYEDLRHVVVHELTHAVMFDLLYGRNAAAMIARQSFYSVPLWFAEGMAEYLSLGIDTGAETYVRDGTIQGYLPPLEYAGGFIVYKMGQCAVGYLTDRFGEERMREILRKTRQLHSFNDAFHEATGLTVGAFDEQWRVAMRKKYLPLVTMKESPERFARRLTDHRRDESHLNTAPAISPEGDRIVYFSDRREYTDVYLMSAFDGKVIGRLVRGERSNQFEAIPSMRSSLTWAPDGRRIALTVKSGGRDVLDVISADNGRVLDRFELPCESLYYPAWSPVGDSIAVVGVTGGRADLWLVDARRGKGKRLTDDAWDEEQPAWSPDGRTLTFASDRLAPVVLQAQRTPTGFGRYGIYSLDLASGEVTRTVETYGSAKAPVWSPDGRRLVFISDRDGTPNVYLYEVDSKTFVQLTDVIGGILTVSWSRQNDRVVFSAFDQGGIDVFAVNQTLSLDEVVARLRRESPQAVFDTNTVRLATGNPIAVPPNHAALRRDAGQPPRSSPGPSHFPDSTVVVLPESLTAHRPDTLAAAVPGSLTQATPESLATAEHGAPAGADTLVPPPVPPPAPFASTGLTHVDSLAARGFATRPDTTRPLPVHEAPHEHGGPFALSDSTLGQKPKRYRSRLTPDQAGGGLYATSGLGFVGSAQLSFSDFMGDRTLSVAFDVFSASLKDANALVFYGNRRRRLHWGIGGFQFENYFSSRVTTLGELLDTPRLFSERTYGGLVNLEYPVDRFRRLELNFTQMFLERQFFAPNSIGDLVPVGTEYRSVTSPTVSWVSDNALFGYYGPVNGHRYNLTYAPALPVFEHSIEYHTVTLDMRNYWGLTHGYSVAGRLLLGTSAGAEPQTFRMGGAATLRGYPDYGVLGTHIAITSLEVRYPFIQQLDLVGPLPVGSLNLRGVAFADAGLVWSGDSGPRIARTNTGDEAFEDFKFAFGVGLRSNLAFVILRTDVAWRTDFQGTSGPRWHVSVGPEF